MLGAFGTRMLLENSIVNHNQHNVYNISDNLWVENTFLWSRKVNLAQAVSVPHGQDLLAVL